MIMAHDFRRDLAAIDWFSPDQFALVRFADGERAILEGKVGQTADGWKQPTEDFKGALADALWYPNRENSEGYHIGISCPCCDPEGHRFYLNKFKPELHSRLTFSNLLVNANTNEFVRRVMSSPPRSIGWVGPYPMNGELPPMLYPVAWVPRNPMCSLLASAHIISQELR